VDVFSSIFRKRRVHGCPYRPYRKFSCLLDKMKKNLYRTSCTVRIDIWNEFIFPPSRTFFFFFFGVRFRLRSVRLRTGEYVVVVRSFGCYSLA